jgi:hypothetical protein
MSEPKRNNTSGLRPPWPKGTSGNPGGRPRKRPVTERYEVFLEEPLPDDLRVKLHLKRGATYGDALAKRQILAAILGKSPNFAREVREAIEGKSPQRLEITTPEDREIRIHIVEDEPAGRKK